MHELRKKVIEDGKRFIDNKYVKKLKEINDRYVISHSYLLNISIRSEIGFNSFLQDTNHLYKKDIKIHDRFFKLVNEFVNSTDISQYFKKEIEPSLKGIINIQNSGIKELPLDREFEKYWGYLIPANGEVYINLFDAHGRAYGLQIDNTIISVTGTNDFNPDENTVMYYPDILVCSYIHEASHWYIDKYINEISKKYNRGVKNAFNNILSKLNENQRSTIINHYDNLRGYIEESIVRISESYFLTPSVFKGIWRENKIEKEKNKKVDEQINQGFVFSKEIIEKLKQNKDMKSKIDGIYNMFVNLKEQ